MNLLIFPGGGNPDASSRYAAVYSIIRREARKHGYQRIFTDVRWPGHTSISNHEDSAPLTFSGALQVARRRIASMPRGAFAILARSFGCYIALQLASQGETRGRRPAKIILWGPMPHWQLWELFVLNLRATQTMAREKGLKIDERFYASIKPVESLIQAVAIPTVVIAGTKDQYCTPAFLSYLRVIANKNPFVTCRRPVVGAPHEVTDECKSEVIRSYAQGLFGE